MRIREIHSGIRRGALGHRCCRCTRWCTRCTRQKPACVPMCASVFMIGIINLIGVHTFTHFLIDRDIGILSHNLLPYLPYSLSSFIEMCACVHWSGLRDRDHQNACTRLVCSAHAWCASTSITSGRCPTGHPLSTTHQLAQHRKSLSNDPTSSKGRTMYTYMARTNLATLPDTIGGRSPPTAIQMITSGAPHQARTTQASDPYGGRP